MQSFEAKLAQATAPNNREGILGAIGLVVNAKGMAQNLSSGFWEVRKQSDTPQAMCCIIMRQAVNP